MAARQVGQDAQRSPLGYLPFVRHTDDALDYALKSTAAGIHRRLSQARQIREEMIHDQNDNHDEMDVINRSPVEINDAYTLSP